MSILIDRIESYKQNKFEEFKAHYQTLKDGQKPHTLVVTCADSRVCPQEFAQAQAGELFLVRNAGNLVPPFAASETPSNEALTIEYGVVALGIKEIVICGHRSCGAMAGLQNTDQLGALPLVQKALETYKAQHLETVEQTKNLEDLIEWNVDEQLRSLMTYGFIKERVEAGQLKLIGLAYDFVEGEISYKSEMSSNGEVTT